MLSMSSKSPQILYYSKDYRKTDLIELWSDRLLDTLVANPSKHHFGQEVLHGVVKRYENDLGNMNTLTFKIKEDIEFQKGINVKLNPEIFS
jgi:hypothetical protein